MRQGNINSALTASIFLLTVSLLTGIVTGGLTAQAESKAGFINRPLEELSSEDKALNRAYLEKEMKITAKERILFLIDALKSPDTCYLSREILIDVGSPAIPYLREVVKDRNNRTIMRTEALKTLKGIGDTKAYELVEKEIEPIPLTYNPDDVEFQNIYLQMKLHGLGGAEKMDALIEMLRDKNKSRLAREALIKVGRPAVNRLIEVLQNKSNPFISRLDALWSLKEIKDTASLPYVIEVLNNPQETDQLRELAAYTLGEFRDERAISALEDNIEHWSPGPQTGTYNVRKTAIKALEKIRDR